MIKAWKRFSAYSNYYGAILTNLNGRWAVIVLVIMISTIIMSLFQDVNYIAIPAMVGGGITVQAASTSYTLNNNPKSRLYPITKEKQTKYIIFDHVGPVVLFFLLFALASFFTNFFFNPNLFPSLSVFDARAMYVFNNLILALNVTTIYVQMLPSLFIEDLKVWYIKAIIPLIIHSLIFYLSVNIFTNNYSLVIGSFSLHIGSYIALAISLVWFTLNIIKSYKVLVKKL